MPKNTVEMFFEEYAKDVIIESHEHEMAKRLIAEDLKAATKEAMRRRINDLNSTLAHYVDLVEEKAKEVKALQLEIDVAAREHSKVRKQLRSVVRANSDLISSYHKVHAALEVGGIRD